MLEDKKRAYYKMITEMPGKMNKNIRIKEKHKLFRQKTKRVLFKSKIKQIEIAYNNNEAKKFHQEVNGTRKGFKP
jgi:hypothetical protein